MQIVNTLGPVFLLVALGAALRRGRFFDDALLRGLNRLAYWVALPALLFVKLAVAPPERHSATVLWILLAATTAAILLSWLGAKLLGLKGPRVGTFIQAGFRGNLAFLGLPVIFFAFSEATGPSAAEDAQTMAVLSLGPLIAYYNVVAVVALLASRHTLSWSAVGRVATGLATNPLIIACLAGFVWSQLGWALPKPITRSLALTGQLALPLALLCIGGTLVTTGLRGQVIAASLASAIKVALCPLIGLGLAYLLGATATEMQVALILLACPTAVSSFVLAEQLGGDGPLAAGAILISTLASIASLSVVIGTM